MQATRTHGAPSWSELTTPDTQAAKTFYGKLFDWTFDDMPMDNMTYHVAKVAGESVAGIMSLPPGAPAMPPAWGTYITVDNVDECVKRVDALGGKVMVPPTDIPNIGRFALLADPQGALISVITYEMAAGD